MSHYHGALLPTEVTDQMGAAIDAAKEFQAEAKITTRDEQRGARGGGAPGTAAPPLLAPLIAICRLQ